jgi:uncharacterized protein (DUF433 family)
VASHLTEVERKTVAYALRHARGRYVAGRAAQLSGVPKSTVYDWRREGVFEPDFTAARPAMWSYRDLVLLRLLAWLRQGGMARRTASKKVISVRDQLSGGADVRFILATPTDVILSAEDGAGFVDERDNLLPSSDFFSLLATFDLHEPIDELRSVRRGTVWAPDLVTPSAHSFISPWVLAGEPCVERTRIPTSAIYALRTDRALPVEAITALYPGLTADAAEDVIHLERRLRGGDVLQPAAA